MVISKTRTVEISIQAVSPLFGTGPSAANAARVPSIRPAVARPVARASGGKKARIVMMVILLCCASERVLIALAGADPHGLFDGGNENLAIADLARAG